MMRISAKLMVSKKEKVKLMVANHESQLKLSELYCTVSIIYCSILGWGAGFHLGPLVNLKSGCDRGWRHLKGWLLSKAPAEAEDGKVYSWPRHCHPGFLKTRPWAWRVSTLRENQARTPFINKPQKSRGVLKHSPYSRVRSLGSNSLCEECQRIHIHVLCFFTLKNFFF